MSKGPEKMLLPQQNEKYGSWVQTERGAHEAFSRLIDASPVAARVMHLLISRVSDNNAIVISQGMLSRLLNVHRRSVVRAIELLERDRWIEVRQIGDRGTINAYILNDRVAWVGSRDGLRYSLFSATVIVSEKEQPDRDELGEQEPLRKLPTLYSGEQQLPSGPGEPPPSQPALPGMDVDLPARVVDPTTGEVIG
jgi:hypothetical protein